MELTGILRCPETGKKLRFDDGEEIVRVENSNLEYPIVDGIVDFCGRTEDKGSTAYDKVAYRNGGSLSRILVFFVIFRDLCSFLISILK